MSRISLKTFYRFISLITVTAFVATTSVPSAIAQNISNVSIPAITVSSYTPALIKGMIIHPEDPFLFDFIVHPGEDQLKDETFKQEANKLIKYFMASLTIPEKEMWVNLSPTEKDRIIPDTFSQTEMGRDLLAQDYLLKQLTASLMYPENETGKRFWEQIRSKLPPGADLNSDVLNKVWIVPDGADIYTHKTGIFIVNAHLKVMMEGDYLNRDKGVTSKENENTIQADLIKQIVIPAIEREVNEGKTFANLRQIYNAVILATWYKNNLRQSLLGQNYVNQGKVEGIQLNDPTMKEKIYQQYLDAFKKGAFDLMKEEYDPSTQEVITRKYISGGADFSMVGMKETGESNILKYSLLGSETVQTRLADPKGLTDEDLEQADQNMKDWVQSFSDLLNKRRVDVDDLRAGIQFMLTGDRFYRRPWMSAVLSKVRPEQRPLMGKVFDELWRRKGLDQRRSSFMEEMIKQNNFSSEKKFGNIREIEQGMIDMLSGLPLEEKGIVIAQRVNDLVEHLRTVTPHTEESTDEGLIWFDPELLVMDIHVLIQTIHELKRKGDLDEPMSFINSENVQGISLGDLLYRSLAMALDPLLYHYGNAFDVGIPSSPTIKNIGTVTYALGKNWQTPLDGMRKYVSLMLSDVRGVTDEEIQTIVTDAFNSIESLQSKGLAAVPFQRTMPSKNFKSVKFPVKAVIAGKSVRLNLPFARIFDLQDTSKNMPENGYTEYPESRYYKAHAEVFSSTELARRFPHLESLFLERDVEQTINRFQRLSIGEVLGSYKSTRTKGDSLNVYVSTLLREKNSDIRLGAPGIDLGPKGPILAIDEDMRKDEEIDTAMTGDESERYFFNGGSRKDALLFRAVGRFQRDYLQGKDHLKSIGIDFDQYQKRGHVAVYYFIRDLRKVYGIGFVVSPRVVLRFYSFLRADDKIFKLHAVSAKDYFTLERLLRKMYAEQRLKNYKGVSGLDRFMKEYLDQLPEKDRRGSRLKVKFMAKLIDSRTKLAAVLGVSEDDSQLSDWNDAPVDVTVKSRMGIEITKNLYTSSEESKPKPDPAMSATNKAAQGDLFKIRAKKGAVRKPITPGETIRVNSWSAVRDWVVELVNKKLEGADFAKDREDFLREFDETAFNSLSKFLGKRTYVVGYESRDEGRSIEVSLIRLVNRIIIKLEPDRVEKKDLARTRTVDYDSIAITDNVFVDQAMSVTVTREETPGGIDLNPSTINMNVEGKRSDFTFTSPSISPAMTIQGLQPIIINITPIMNVPLLLGIKEELKPEELSSVK
jgi:hypothetical protein